MVLQVVEFRVRKVLHACAGVIRLRGRSMWCCPGPSGVCPLIFWPLPDTEPLPHVLSSLSLCLCPFCSQELCHSLPDCREKRGIKTLRANVDGFKFLASLQSTGAQSRGSQVRCFLACFAFRGFCSISPFQLEHKKGKKARTSCVISRNHQAQQQQL